MKKIASILLTAALLVGMMSVFALPVFAGNGTVSCLVYENGSFVTKSFAGEWLNENSAIFGRVHFAGSGKTVFRDRVEFSGEHTIILCDGADLVFENGIRLEYAATLNIYAQSRSGNVGKLTVYGKGGNAAIGGNCGIDCAENPNDRKGKPGGTVNIHGGNIEVYSESVGFGGGDGGAGKKGGEESVNVTPEEVAYFYKRIEMRPDLLDCA